MASKDIIYKEHTFKLSYELVNPAQEMVLLILHGWGSNKEIMKQAFGNTLPDYKHIYLDMPGFGKSTNEMILTTVDYANIVQHFLDELGVTATIAMRHSFGGKVFSCIYIITSSGDLSSVFFTFFTFFLVRTGFFLIAVDFLIIFFTSSWFCPIKYKSPEPIIVPLTSYISTFLFINLLY